MTLSQRGVGRLEDTLAQKGAELLHGVIEG